MRQLFPDSLESVDPVEVYGRLAAHGDRPRVRLNMITSVDGAATVDGKSAGMGASADKEIFQTLRTLADVILVGAATVRSENYGPADLGDDNSAKRRSWFMSTGLAVPVLCCVWAASDRGHGGVCRT
jgi:RibD C-terminal domain